MPVRRSVAVCTVAAAVLIVLGAIGLARAGVATRAVTADGLPMLVAAPAGHASENAGVVVAHGFAGSARLMRGFADTLARRGYVVVIPDLSGHGTNTRPLPDALSAAGSARLQRDLDVAVGYLRSAYGLALSRIALVGHSLGASAVTKYAVDHPGLAATVAISLGSAEDLPGDPAVPRNLLVLTGGLEFPGFQAGALDAVRKAYPGGAVGPAYGSASDGTARRAYTVAGTEHISVLYADATHRETAEWIDTAFGTAAGSAGPHPRDRVLPAALVLLGLAFGLVPLASLVLGGAPSGLAGDHQRTAVAAEGAVSWPLLGVGTLVGLVAAVALAPALPTAWLPLAVGGYTAGFFLTIGAALLALRPITGSSVAFRRPSARLMTAAVALVAYAAVAIALPVHLGFTNAWPAGPRLAFLPCVVVCVAVLLLGVEVTARTWWAKLVVLGLTAAALLTAALIGWAPGFIVLVIPLLALLVVWHLVWSGVLARRGAPAWVRALVGAVLVAWPIALTLPIVTGA